MVGNVGSKIGVEAIGPAQYVVLQIQLVYLLLALTLGQVFPLEQFGGVQPQGAVLLISPALLGQQIHCLGHIARVMQLRFKKPLVVLDAIFAQVVLHFRNVHRQTELGHGVQPLLLRQVLPAVSVLVVDGLGQLPDVIPLIAVLREWESILSHNQLHIPGIDGLGKLGDLVTCVVDVEFLPGVIAIPPEDVGQRIPQHAAPGVAHMHGSSGVCGDELHHYLLAPALAGAAVPLGVGLHCGKHRAIPSGSVKKVQKPWSGDFRPLEVAVCQLQVV